MPRNPRRHSVPALQPVEIPLRGDIVESSKGVFFMMLKPELISFKLCPFVQRAAILLNEKAVAYDLTYIRNNFV